MIEKQIEQAVIRSVAILELQKLRPLEDQQRRKIETVIHFGNVLKSMFGLLGTLPLLSESTEDDLNNRESVLLILSTVNLIFSARLLEVIRTHKLYADFSFLLAESEFGFEFNNALEEWKSETSSDNCN